MRHSELDNENLLACSHSIAGHWHGIRREACGVGEPDEFVASFHALPFGETNVYGELASGSPPGSELIGSQRGALVRFREAPHGTSSSVDRSPHPCEFVGRISSDGTVMRGCWRRAEATGPVGTWTARRAAVAAESRP